MPTLLGPSHYIYYASLHRRRLWLAHLADTFERFAAPTWPKIKKNLDTNYARMLTRLSMAEHLGIQAPLRLQDVIDDTPIDSFLSNLTDELDAYELNFFSLMENNAVLPQWREALEQTSLLWGRELAQECLMAKEHGAFNRRTVKGLFELFHTVLQGGEFSWKPLLLRRLTDHELQYELRRCPHRKAAEVQPTNQACQLEAMVYRGFIQALVPDVQYERLYRSSYCVDELRLHHVSTLK